MRKIKKEICDLVRKQDKSCIDDELSMIALCLEMSDSCMNQEVRHHQSTENKESNQCKFNHNNLQKWCAWRDLNPHGFLH
jgi:hypothetical protein